jgi:two-component system phosphate regulon sensor histidine kinase PhoR
MNEQEQVGLSQTRFLSLLTHELRSPLNSIHGYLDLALMGAGGELSAQQHELIQRARMASQHLYALLEDLLCIARADSGQLRLQRTVMHLPDIIDNAVEELALAATDQSIVLRVDVEPQLPLLYADAVRIQQVLRNLVDNAIRFTPEGGGVKIAASVERGPLPESAGSSSDGDGDVAAIVCLRVSDTGIGIAPEFHQRIFERFYRVLDKNANRSGGQGLGLSVVKLIVELHEGTVTVESAPGEGSTFTCFIPLQYP